MTCANTFRRLYVGVAITLACVTLSGCSLKSITNTLLEMACPRWGYIDTKNKLVVNIYAANKYYPYLEGSLGKFSCGRARIRVGPDKGSDCRFLFIDREGIRSGPDFWAAGNFSEQLAAAAPSRKEGFGYLDRNYNWVIKPTFARARGFKEGLSAVQLKSNSLWGFVDKTGRLAIPCQFDDVRDFSEGLAVFRRGTKYGFIDKKGQERIPATGDFAWSFSEGLAAVDYRAGSGKYKRKYLNPDGTAKFEYSFEPGRPDFSLDRSRHFVGEFDSSDFTEDKLKPSHCLEDPVFKNGLAVIQKHCLYGFINTNGEVVIPFAFGFARPFSENCAVVFSKSGNHLCGVVNRDGKLSVECKYKHLSDFSNGLACASATGTLYGFIAPDGIYKIDANIHDLADSFSEGLAAVGVAPICP